MNTHTSIAALAAMVAVVGLLISGGGAVQTGTGTLAAGNTPTPTTTPASTPTTPTSAPTPTAAPTQTPEPTTTDRGGNESTPTAVPTDDDIYYGNESLDSDKDGLNNSYENRIGTNPQSADTDKDGLWDRMELEETNTDPLHRDLIIEVDSVGGEYWLTDSDRENVKDGFAGAPIDNPDGVQGVTVHFEQDDVIDDPPARTVNKSVTETLKAEHRDERAHYYLLVAEDIESKHENLVTTVHGIAYTDIRTAAIDTQSYTWWVPGVEVGSTTMHELGHLLGVRSARFTGIDNHTVNFANYTSVMNYNAPMDYYDFSSGEPHDDWSYIEMVGFHHLTERPAVNATEAG